MSAINLDKIFYPKSIAVVGTGQLGGHIFSTLVHNLIDGGYSGEIYPVHPDYKSIWKRRACPSLFDINSQVDLAVLSEPYTSASKIIKDCIETGVKGLVIISGGKEYNKQERDLEIAAINEAKHSGLRIIGPDCHGIICSSSKLNVSFLNHTPIPGKMAFISQSGAIFSSVFDLSIKESVGFSHFINIGSMPDVNFGDIIDYLGKDYDVSSIVIYAESFRRIRNFMSAARAVSRIKPIIVLKSGRTKAGALAAASHTGNLAGEDGVYDAAFERAGIVRVKTFEELFDCAELLAKQPRPLKPQLAIITNSGGLGVMAVDALSDYGVEPVTLKDETIKKLDGCLPPGWSHTNPVDILGDASPERYKNAVDACLKDSQVKGLLIILSPQVMFRPTEVAESLVGFLKRKPYPIFTCWLGGSRMDHGREIFNRTEIPTFDSPERAVRAFMDLYRYSKNLEILQQIPSKLPGKLEFNHEKADKLIQKELLKENLLLTSKKAKDLINSYGIPVGRLKKTVSDKKAKPKILRFELSAGSKCDRDFGPVILFGLGGVMAENKFIRLPLLVLP